MLATWLVEFFLSRCNELDDLCASESVSSDIETLQTQRTILEDDLRQFFDTYKVRLCIAICSLNLFSQSNLDKNVIYELIQGHGRTDMYLHYATVVGDCERVIEHWILEEQWTKAIDVLNGQVSMVVMYCNAP